MTDRRIEDAEDSGVVVLARPEIDYTDGAEAALLEILRSESDLGSANDALLARATSWAERYHLDPARSNVLRAFDLPSGARVLEVGAGCGAVTRYLGETFDRVDALEPMPARAVVARERTRDLPGVQVLLGEVTDLPEEPVYDLAVVIGVLEYVGDGTGADPAYREFLAEIRRRLAPGGHLILAIENKFGVKYLAGAPEDHTDRPYEGVEDYPVSTGVRTFARTELVDLMTAAGFTPRPLIAFPDYKMTRVVFDPEALPVEARPLLTRVPSFPSPDPQGTAPRAFDEARAWQALVSAGLAGETGNSFVVVAGTDEDAALWPAGRAAVYLSERRRRAYVTRAVVTVDEEVRIDRAPLTTPGADVTGPRLVASSESFVPGEDLGTIVAERGPAGAADLIEAWATLVAADPTALDLIPANVVVTPDGDLRAVDQEWRDPAATADRVLRRGVLLLAESLVGRGTGWPPQTTVRAAAQELGTLVGLPADGSWLVAAVEDEARFNALAGDARPDLTGPGRVDFFGEAHRGGLRLLLDTGSTTTAALVTAHLAHGPDTDAWHEAIARLDDPDVEVAALLAVAQEQRAVLVDELRMTRQHAENLEQALDAVRTRSELEVAATRQHAENLERMLEQVRIEGLAATQHLTDQLAAPAARAEELQGELAAMRRTISWRLTRPLRALRRGSR